MPRWVSPPCGTSNLTGKDWQDKMQNLFFLKRGSPLPLFFVGFGLILIGLAFVSIPAAGAQGSANPTPTRVGSLFDPPAATQPTSASSATLVTVASATPGPSATPKSAETTTAPTRVGSIFDPPAQQATTPPGTAAPTRVPSIFDAPSQPTTAPAGGSTGRVGSIFDASAQATAAPGAGTGNVGSIFDTMQQNDVIRFEGDEKPDREYCLSCHANPYLQMTLASGEVIFVAFDEEAYSASVHGQHGTDGYLCIRCHEGMNEYPHAPVEAATARDLTIEALDKLLALPYRYV